MRSCVRGTTCAVVAALMLTAACVDAARDLEQNGRKLAQGRSAEHKPKLVHFIRDPNTGGPPDWAQPDLPLLPEAAANNAVSGYARNNGGPTGVGISYHGGPVMTSSAGNSIYVIWYGDWTAANSAFVSGTTGLNAQGAIRNFLMKLGGSFWFNTNSQYLDGAKVPIKNTLTYSGSEYSVLYPYGYTLNDGNIWSLVQDYLAANAAAADPNAVYLVLTSSDVNQASSSTSAFCTQYCGWHSHGTIGTKDVKYAWIGNPARCPTACNGNTAAQDPSGAYGIVSISAHEIAEAVSDPALNAWYDTRGNENADKCAWTWGTTYTAADGRKVNMNLGGIDYLVQQNWSPKSGTCVQGV